MGGGSAFGTLCGGDWCLPSLPPNTLADEGFMTGEPPTVLTPWATDLPTESPARSDGSRAPTMIRTLVTSWNPESVFPCPPAVVTERFGSKSAD